MIERQQQATNEAVGAEARPEWTAPVLTRFDANDAEAGDIANPDGAINS